MNLDFLLGQLKVADHPGLDSTDLRLDEIITLSQAGQHLEAADLSASILLEENYDIRLICFFLYGYWQETGLASLEPLLNCLNSLIVENWQAIGPLENQSRQLEKSLDMLLRQILKKLLYEESRSTALWHAWLDSLTSQVIKQILTEGDTFCRNLNLRLDTQADAVIDQWRKIEKWLLNFQQLSTNHQAKLEESNNDIHAVTPAAENLEAVTPTTSNSIITPTGLPSENSYPLEILLKKLAAFERMIAEKKFSRAALLAEDINLSLANFDPKVYFPKLFESFVKLQVLNFESLMGYEEYRDNPQWLMMQEWLKVDIDGFINDESSLHDD
jgi:hypothetical protein